MFSADRWSYFKSWIYRHIEGLGEVSLKHRSNILMLSVLMLFIDPDVKLILGKASLAGLGITIEPTQTIPIGLFLFILLIYRLSAFWASVLLESGINEIKADGKARYEIDPAYHAEERKASDMDQAVRMESYDITYKWKVRQILWEFILPNLLALIGLAKYIYSFYIV